MLSSQLSHIKLRSLKNQAEFDLVNKCSSKLHTPHFILVKACNFAAIKTEEQVDLYFGMKVGRKLGNAVIRNKIKRRIRHIMRLVVKLPKISASNLALIIIPRKGFEKVEFSVLLESFKKTILK